MRQRMVLPRFFFAIEGDLPVSHRSTNPGAQCRVRVAKLSASSSEISCGETVGDDSES